MKHQIIYQILLFSLIFSVVELKAQQEDDSQEKSSYAFSLEEAVQFALENNAEIKNAELDKGIAKKQVWETTAMGLPQASASYQFQHLPGDIPTFEIAPGQEVALGVENSATYDVTISQLVFSGEYIVGLQAARTFLQVSDKSLEKSMLDIEEMVSSNYYTIMVLEKNIAILDSSMQNMESIVKEMKAMNQVGLVSKTDADQIQLTLNITKNTRDALERQLEIMYKVFKIGVGLGNEDEVTLTETIETILLQVNADQLLEQQFSIEDNVDYQLFTNQERISELTVRRYQSMYLPTVSAYYLYQDRTEKADFDFTINQIVGVNVNVPIFSSGQRNAKVQQAKLDLEKMRNNKAVLTENLEMQIEQARYDYINASEQFQTQSQNITLSEKIYNDTMEKYKRGMSSSLELTQIHQQYLTEQSNYFNALLELLNAKEKLEKLIIQ